MPNSNVICTQANNSTLPATPAVAKYADAPLRNLSNSSSDAAVQSFVLYLQQAFPDLTKIRFKRHHKGRFYVLRVKAPAHRFAAKGFTVQNTALNFLASYPQSRKEFAV